MKPDFYNRIQFKGLRKGKRNSMTPAEVLLWKRLKGKQLGYKFRRQHGIGPFIVDFYCPEKRLAIEIDGHTHEDKEVQKRDFEKEEFLKERSFEILRFWNSEVYDLIEGVLVKIQDKLND